MRAHRLAAALWLAAVVSIGAGAPPAASSASSWPAPALPFVGPAQGSDPSLLTLERIYSSGEFGTERFGPARWLADGSGYTTVERSAAARGGDDIVRYDAETGAREVLVPAMRFVSEESSSPLSIDDYTWSDDGSKLLLYTNSQRVWRQNTRGDYWVINLQNGGLQQLGGEAAPATLMFAKFSPDATRVAYVRENNIYFEDLESLQITALTTDGATNIINGTFDWVYEEEFGLRDGFRWSPDGRKDCLLAARFRRGAGFLPDQQHRHLVSGDHSDSLSQGRHDELGESPRCGEPRREPDALDRAAR